MPSTGWRAGLRSLAKAKEAMEVLGQYIDCDDRSHSILIVRLSSRDCEVVEQSEHAELGTIVAVWIGAVGPFCGLACEVSQDLLKINFDPPINTATIEHFRYC